MRILWTSVFIAVDQHHHTTITIIIQWLVSFVKETPLVPSMSAVLEMFVSLVDREKVRAGWRSVWRGSGGPCATIHTLDGDNRNWQSLCAGRKGSQVVMDTMHTLS